MANGYTMNTNPAISATRGFLDSYMRGIQMAAAERNYRAQRADAKVKNDYLTALADQAKASSASMKNVFGGSRGGGGGLFDTTLPTGQEGKVAIDRDPVTGELKLSNAVPTGPEPRFEHDDPDLAYILEKGLRAKAPRGVWDRIKAGVGDVVGGPERKAVDMKYGIHQAVKEYEAENGPLSMAQYVQLDQMYSDRLDALGIDARKIDKSKLLGRVIMSPAFGVGSLIAGLRRETDRMSPDQISLARSRAVGIPPELSGVINIDTTTPETMKIVMDKWDEAVQADRARGYGNKFRNAAMRVIRTFPGITVSPGYKASPWLENAVDPTASPEEVFNQYGLTPSQQAHPLRTMKEEIFGPSRRGPSPEDMIKGAEQQLKHMNEYVEPTAQPQKTDFLGMPLKGVEDPEYRSFDTFGGSTKSEKEMMLFKQEQEKMLQERGGIRMADPRFLEPRKGPKVTQDVELKRSLVQQRKDAIEKLFKQGKAPDKYRREFPDLNKKYPKNPLR